jgi:hypothetical protein
MLHSTWFAGCWRQDAIGRTYQHIATELWTQTSIDVEVIEDSRLGLKVLLTTAMDSENLETIRQVISPELNKLAYHWELHCTQF